MAANKTEDTAETPAEKGRLVLATGAIVTVPAESVSVSTEHYDPQLKATVPVVSSFILND